MDEKVKNFIPNSTRSSVNINRNCTIKILHKFLLASFLFIGVSPLHSAVTQIVEKEPNEGIVAIHFGPGDEDFIAIGESNDEMNTSDTIIKEQ